MGIAFSGAEGGVAQKGLNIAYVNAAFQEVGGKRVAQAVDGSVFLNSGSKAGFFEYMLSGVYVQMDAFRLAGEKPAFYAVSFVIVF